MSYEIRNEDGKVIERGHGSLRYAVAAVTVCNDQETRNGRPRQYTLRVDGVEVQLAELPTPPIDPRT